MEYARELVAECGSEAGREQLRQAERALEMTRQFHGQNQSRAALSALGQAREAARRASRECQDSGRLQQRYERLRGELDRLQERFRTEQSSGSTVANDLARQAAEQLELARRHLSENEVESAQLALQAAHIALRQAQRRLSGEF
jgi:hypothetical protein